MCADLKQEDIAKLNLKNDAMSKEIVKLKKEHEKIKTKHNGEMLELKM
tara:strand:+ start:688 stop:831 length:144 start_codon:yes stop_codon:yes gene_type:complete